MGSLIGSGALIILLTAVMTQTRNLDAIKGCLVLMFSALIYAMVIGSIVWYKAWQSIQDEHVRTTPGKAVGFLFIPIYSLYWVFQVIPGFAEDYNSYIQRHNIGGHPLSRQFFMTTTIVLLVTNLLAHIPSLAFSLTVSVIGFVMGMILFNQVIDAVNIVVEGKSAGAGGAVFPARQEVDVPWDNTVLGVIAILISSSVFIYAIAGPYIWSSRFLAFLMAVFQWGVVIFLGYLCKHPVLRWFAMAAPAIALIFRIVNIFTMKYYY